jgi:D-alanine-D-alanine ligase
MVRRASGWEEIRLDVVFPVLHGKNGEDGTIQGLLELAGIPYVGCGVMASANCMDKDTAKRLFVSAGVPTAKWILATPEQDIQDLDAKIQEGIQYPVFVKPANAGSSIGVSKAHHLEELKEALKEAFRYDWKVLLEETIYGRECECAVLGNRCDAKTSAVVGEILPVRELYDFEGKYIDGSTQLEIPASLPEEQTKLIQSTALKAYHALGCEGLSRVDFFAREDGSVILNEINTLPGFTNISMYPKLFLASGYTYSGLLDALIQAALNR